jgi:hypothetical protein
LIENIQITELKSSADVSVYEPYLINLYKPKYNNDFKTTDNLTITLPEPLWEDKKVYMKKLAIEQSKLKNTISFQQAKANNRINKSKSLVKFEQWLSSQTEDRVVRTKDIWNESGLSSKALEKLREQNTYVALWFKNNFISIGKYKISMNT